FLGPSIRVCCFEVGEEVAAEFDARFIDRTLGPKSHVDIAALTIGVLRERGFAEERIVDPGLCTRCVGSIFHSYRRDKRSGRNLAIVAQ
ncbi:MAG TPA: laccase domain-containing protein, partial [Thermoanaerobaculia bacterium]